MTTVSTSPNLTSMHVDIYTHTHPYLSWLVAGFASGSAV